MIFCKELNKSFETKEEMFAAVKANKDKIIGLKKATIKESDPVYAVNKSLDAVKGESSKSEPVSFGSTIYPVINTTNLYDSHGDVHINKLWDVSVVDQKGKLHYIINHELEIGKVISYPNDVNPIVVDMTWKELGYEYPGSTQALIFEALLSEVSNVDAAKAIIQGIPLQNSVRMRYISMTLCIDSNEEGFKQERENFYKYLPDIANKQDVLDSGYFWAITEAAIYLEGSAVLRGSNPNTPILTVDPSKQGSQENEEIDPSKQGSQTESPIVKNKSYINLI